MKKAINLTKNKLLHRYFDNNLQKIFPADILENTAGKTLDSCFKVRFMLGQLSDLNFK